MKGVILAGGTGSRLMPLTSVTNKHLLAIYDKPMIFYPVEALKSAGIKNILVITGTNHAGAIFSLLGSGKEFGVNFTFRVQDEAGGIPHAIALAEDFVGVDKFISINGDNILTESIKEIAENFEKGSEEMHICIYETSSEEAKKAGVVVLDKDNSTVKKVIEKPENPPSNLISIGVYLLTSDCFKVIRKLKPSLRGELEIADLQNHYIKKGTLSASRISGDWMDAGSFDELKRANDLIKKISEKNK